MPRCVFKLVWDTIASGKEIFGYVVNLARNGDQYWVLAHVTPTFDPRGRIVGYHSNRRVPARRAVDAIRPLYATLLQVERRHQNRAEGLEASTAALQGTLHKAGLTYEQFVFSLGGGRPMNVADLAPRAARPGPRRGRTRGAPGLPALVRRGAAGVCLRRAR
jgi:hypothetical protein